MNNGHINLERDLNKNSSAGIKEQITTEVYKLLQNIPVTPYSVILLLHDCILVWLGRGRVDYPNSELNITFKGSWSSYKR